jgi:hypothetical protein
MWTQVCLEVPIGHQFHHYQHRLTLWYNTQQTYNMVCVEGPVKEIME